MGFEVEPGGAGEARVRLNCGSHLHNLMQRVHGGAIAALADAAMGIAFFGPSLMMRISQLSK